MQVLRCGSAIFVAGAGNCQVARCGGGHVLGACWRSGRAKFVAGAGNREVASWVEVNVARHRDLSCCLEGLESRNCLAWLLDVCAPMWLPA